MGFARRREIFEDLRIDWDVLIKTFRCLVEMKISKKRYKRNRLDIYFYIELVQFYH